MTDLAPTPTLATAKQVPSAQDALAVRRAGSPGTALVTGVTGYVGGLLVQPLLDAGWSVRVLTRSTGKLADRPWRSRVEVVEGDATDPDTLTAALRGVDAAYYLLHSMDGVGDYVRRDRDLAARFAESAEQEGVRRIVYLGGLHPDGELSTHLASRVQVGQVLLDSGVPTACLQAAVIVGDGSASFAMLRYLTQRLPAMVAPRWLNNRIQPIAIDDVISYLVGAADLPADVNRTFDIGGPEVLTYAEMIKEFAEVTGLRQRAVVTVPVLTPRLASHWVGVVTPISAGIAKPLVGSLIHEVVCKEHDISRYVPDPPGGLMGFRDAVELAMQTVPPSTSLHHLVQTTAATALTAAIASWAAQPDSAWYRSLDRPAWQPPTLAAPAIWGAMYAGLIGTSTSALSSYDDRGLPEQTAGYQRALWGNLGLNAAWNVVFWRLRRPGAAAAVAAAWAASSADLTRRAAPAGTRHRNTVAAYAAWSVLFTALSGDVARRNRRNRRNR